MALLSLRHCTLTRCCVLKRRTGGVINVFDTSHNFESRSLDIQAKTNVQKPKKKSNMAAVGPEKPRRYDMEWGMYKSSN